MLRTAHAELLYYLFEDQGFEVGDIIRVESILGQQPESLWAAGVKASLPVMISRGLLMKLSPNVHFTKANYELTQRGRDALMGYMNANDNSTHEFSFGVV